jgi:hypothetical protein
MSVLETLIKARALIEKHENWTQGKFFDNRGRRCALGALYDAEGIPYTQSATTPSDKALRSAMGEFPGTFNDTHTHADVLAAFDRAIEAERAKEAS